MDYLNKITIHDLSHILDIVAIPTWILLFIYAYTIKKKTIWDKMLIILSILVLFFDSLFSYDYIKGNFYKYN